MSYEKQNFEDNQVLEASDLNHIEDGIVDNERAIEKKQDKLVSGSNIKTINNQSLIGSGNISINPDLSGYATKEFVQSEIEQAQLEDKEIDLSGYATKSELNNKADKTELNSYATKSELNNKANKTELNIYATKSELNNKANRTELDSYATKEFVQSEIEQAQLEDKEIDLSGYATKSELNNKADKTHTHTEYVNPDLSGYQQKTDNNLQTSSKTITGAINELFQSANNGKQLIANAIGEPLNSEDTFSAMSNDINGLLSQFKTNMMNAGVVVESGDKFERLIEKIKGLTEGEGNKGIQYTSGKITGFLQNYNTGDSITFNIDCDFVPTVLFLRVASVWGGGYSEIQNIFVSNLSSFTLNPDPRLSSGNLSTCLIEAEIINLTNTSFDIHILNGGAGGSVVQFTDWYAIGVGEEDTTLRDSLADILENKGVEVSPEDDMADLITKVDSIKSGGLDIIAATELPATGRDNQICVITDNPVNNYVFSKEQPSDVEIGLLWFKVEDYNTINTHYSPMIGNNINIQYYLRKCFYYNGSSFVEVNGYIYNNGWNSLSKGYVFIDKDGLHNFKLLYDNGGYASSIPGEGVYFNIENFNGSTRYESQWVSQTKVDFSNYTSLTFSFTLTAPSGNWSYEGFVCCGYGTTTLDNYFHSQGYWDNGDIEYFMFSGEDDPAYSGEQINLTLDISRINTKCYVGIEFAAYLATEITLTSITLT